MWCEVTLLFNIFLIVEKAIGSFSAIDVCVIEEHGQVLTVANWRPFDTFLPQISHEQLQANESKHAETEDGEDHDIRQFLHRLNQGSNNGF